MKKIILTFLAAALAAGCSGKKSSTDRKGDEKTGDRPEGKTRPARPTIKLPFDFPAVSTSAKAGDFVLAPPRELINKAIKGGEKPSFLFSGRRMVKPGPVESTVKESGAETLIPNALIIPIRKGEKVQPGDVVLTFWAAGGSMQRAIVVEGGSPDKPKVRYLDIAPDNPSGMGKKVDTLKPGTFHKLKALWEPGTAVAVKTAEGYVKAVIVNRTGDKLLTVGFAGKMAVYKKKQCVPIPVIPELKKGRSAYVPYLGTFQKGWVKKIDTATGRVHVRVDFAGEKTTVAAPFGDLIRSLRRRK